MSPKKSDPEDSMVMEDSEIGSFASEPSEVSEASDFSNSSIGPLDDASISTAMPEPVASVAAPSPVISHQAKVAEPDEDIPAPQGDNLEKTETLLQDLNTTVVIELTRLPLTTSQIIRIREGEIMRLPRTPSDPVSLVVDGKVFARAELVEIDGELGVRLLEVVGSSN